MGAYCAYIGSAVNGDGVFFVGFSLDGDRMTGWGLIAQIGRARVCALWACYLFTGGNAECDPFTIQYLTFYADFVVVENSTNLSFN